MVACKAPLALTLLASAIHVSANTKSELGPRGIFDPVCKRIREETPDSTEVYYIGHPKYHEGISHWSSASVQYSECVVEPSTAAEVGHVLNIISETRTPFAVKGGGHSTNPGFSSTEGVHISMAQFSEVKYDPATETAEVGAGLIWDDVYEALEPYGVNVVGGRVHGVGVAGFTLGGGYSWKTNQYGLTVDTVVAYELVKPDGSVVTVTAESDPELFWGLKGGLNNFGIVTKFTLKTHPQGEVWGGVATYTRTGIPAISAATAAFSANVTDPKASIITTYNYIGVDVGISLLMFYDGPTPPAGIFDSFLAVPHFTQDVSTRSFLSLVKASPVQFTNGLRSHFQMVPVLDYSPSFIEAVVNQSTYWGKSLTLRSGLFFSYAVEPFLPNIYAHNIQGETAYPTARDRFYSPFNIFFGWLSPLEDSTFQSSVLESARALVAAATREGQSNLDSISLYPNYASSRMPLSQVYGSNVPRLRALKERVDPGDVMGLAGGFKF